MKSDDRNLAVRMRRQGCSYAEILSKVPVAKSTLSLWLRDVGLAKKQMQKLTERRLAGALRGARSRRAMKEKISKEIKNSSRVEIGSLSPRERWLVGTALYWAEGTKEKSYKSGVGLIFNNSDPAMVKFYVQWLEKELLVPRLDIKLSLYIHETKRSSIEEVKNFWTRCLGLPAKAITGVYIKRGVVKTNRKNTGSLYYGTLRVTVSRSSALNRKVAGWIEGITDSVK